MKMIFPLIALTLLVSCSGQGEAVAPDSPAIKYERVAAEEDTLELSYAIITRPYNQSELSFRVGGPALDFDVRPGDFFRKGEVICRVDDRDYLVEKERCAALYEHAESEYRRASALYEKNSISAAAYDRAKAELTVARSNYDRAVNNLSDTYLRAPFDGYVQELFIEPYQDIRASQKILTLIELSRLKAEAFLPEDIASLLGSEGKDIMSSAVIRFDAVRDRTYTPSSIDISKSTSQNNLSYILTMSVSNSDGRLLGGMNGNVTFRLALPSKVLSVPLNAVNYSADKGEYVWVLGDDGTVSFRAVATDGLKDGRALVKSGLKEGEKVVVAGHVRQSPVEK